VPRWFVEVRYRYSFEARKASHAASSYSQCRPTHAESTGAQRCWWAFGWIRTALPGIRDTGKRSTGSNFSGLSRRVEQLASRETRLKSNVRATYYVVQAQKHATQVWRSSRCPRCMVVQTIDQRCADRQKKSWRYWCHLSSCFLPLPKIQDIP
jgi:hypothetical protein